jgi:hypothetical protein
MHPRTSVWAPQKAVGLLIAVDALGFHVPSESAAELHREIGQDAACGRDVALFDVGDGLAAFVDGGWRGRSSEQIRELRHCHP